MIIKDFDSFVNEMYMGPADGAKSFADHQKKQSSLGYYPDAVSAEAGGPGNPAPSAVGEEQTPTMLSIRLGDIEPEGYPGAGGQKYSVEQPGGWTTGTPPSNMRGEPMIQKTM